MGIKSLLAKPFAKYVHKQTQKWATKPVETQQRVLEGLINDAKHTVFGKDHNFDKIKTHKDFVENVPIRDYEGLRPYVNQMLEGKPDVLWKGKPQYFSKTSGTTSGVKYIPLTKESIPTHINAARNAILSYVHDTGNSKFLDKKMIFLSGSPELEKKGDIHYGRLSGIVNHHIPSYLQTNQKPSYETNCIEDWEEKLDAIIGETVGSPMTLISGIPPWVQMYFDKIREQNDGALIKDIFPDFSVFIYGGVNFEPYRAKLFESIGKEIDTIELYPASEGFIAYQDSQTEEGLLLLLDNGMFYEFIPADEYFNENPTRLTIGEVELGVNYAVILNTNAGLWGYSIGDTVKFVSKDPYRVIVSGRIKHFISAFGEHVIGEEVEKAIKHVVSQHPETEIVEFTVAPSVNPEQGKSYHEWYIEFAQMPNDLDAFRLDLDKKMTSINAYYDDLIVGNILQKLEIRPVPKGSFIGYMKSIGKLGGQNKVPRLSNDRKIADELEKFIQ
ncbi:MAG: GH3 auxin-responsive promoter family protein [Cytophagales bacterium]|nr:GH3 auxin-responsive promoter family protein [Cytophagales bacterium]